MSKNVGTFPLANPKSDTAKRWKQLHTEANRRWDALNDALASIRR